MFVSKTACGAFIHNDYLVCSGKYIIKTVLYEKRFSDIWTSNCFPE